MTSTSAYQDHIAGGMHLTNLLRLQYQDFVPTMLSRYSTGVAKSIKPGRIVDQTADDADEGGLVIQVVRSHSDSTRMSADASKDYGRGRTPRGGKIRVRFNTKDPSKNDLRRIENVIETDLFQLERVANSPGVAINFLENELKNIAFGTDEAIERGMHTDETGVIGIVDGDKVASATRYEKGGAYSTAATARIKIKGHSIAMFKEGLYLDFHNPSTGAKLLDEVEVMHVDEEEGSALISVSSRTTIAQNLDAVVANSLIVRSGEYGQGFKAGFGGTFKADYTGDNWIGGKDRSLPENMWLVPIQIRTEATDQVVMNTDIMDQLVNGLSMRMGVDPTKPLQFLAGLKAVNNWRSSAGYGVTTNREQGNRDLVVGEHGLSYVHPEIGTIQIKGAKNARPDRGILWDPEKFEMLYGGFKGHKWTSAGEAGIFRQKVGTNNPHGGGSTQYVAEGVTFCSPIATEVRAMVCVHNIK